MNMRFPWLWPAIIFLAALAACIVTYVIPDTQMRAIVVMSFLFICPGMALVRFLRLNDMVAEWIIAVSLSLAIDAIVGGLFLYTGHWSLSGILITVLVISFMGATGQLVILHPVVAQHLSSLPIFKIPEDIANGATMTIPRVVPSPGVARVNIEDQQTAYLPSYKATASTDQNKDVAETNTIQMPALASSTPAQADIAENDTMHITAIEHIDANAEPNVGDESHSKRETIEEKETVLVPNIQISYSPVHRAKPITHKQPLREEQEPQQTDISDIQEEDAIDRKETALIPASTLEELIKEQNVSPVPGISSSSADKKQAIEEKETVNVPSVQVPNPELLSEQSPADSPASKQEQEEQKGKEPVVTTAKAEPSKEPLKKEQVSPTRTIIPRTNPHKAIVQEPATKSVLRKRRLTKEVVQQEATEQDKI